MTRSTMRDLERRLRDTPAGEPPADLLERLRAEIPPRLDLAAEPPRRPARRLPPRWLRAAAVVVLTLGGAWMLWRLSAAVPAPRAAVEEATAVPRPAATAGGRAIEPGVGAADEEQASGILAQDDLAGRAASSSAPEAATGAGGAEAAQAAPSPATALGSRAAEDASARGPATETTVAETAAAETTAAEGPSPPGGAAATESASRDPLPDERSAPADQGARSRSGGGSRPSAARAPAPPAEPRAESVAATSAATAAAPGSAGASDDRRNRLQAAPPEAPAGGRPAAEETSAAAGRIDLAAADAAEERSSSFPLHAGTGSWALVRDSLRRGLLPPPAAVRVEEVVNAFEYGDPPPAAGEAFRLAAEGASSPFTPGPGDRLLRFGIRARPGDAVGGNATVAEEARVEVDFDPRVVRSWRLLGHDGRGGPALPHGGSAGAGDLRAGHAVTALYEVRLAGEPAPDRPVARLTLRYRVPGSDRFTAIERTLRVADLAPTWESAPSSLRLAAVAAELAEQLAGSRRAESGDLAELARRAASVAAERPGDRRAAELADLAARAAALASAGPRPGEE